MKKQNLLINILLVVIIVGSIVMLGLLINLLLDISEGYYAYKEIAVLNPSDTFMLETFNLYKSRFLQLTFSVIFSALTALASAVILFLLNFKVWKKKKN